MRRPKDRTRLSPNGRPGRNPRAVLGRSPGGAMGSGVGSDRIPVPMILVPWRGGGGTRLSLTLS
jgi:hypothetical protein